MKDQTPNLKSYSPDSLRELFRARGLPAYRADQVSQWLFAKGVDDIAAMTDVSESLRAQLAAEYQTHAFDLRESALSLDGTRKLAFEAPDGAVVEAVIIPEERRNTLCVSTQVGCPLACSFCATGALGFGRNLSTAEIIDQVSWARRVVGAGQSISNVVFMGMGEPLLNLAAVCEAIRILVHPKGFGLAPRRITVSTAGVVPKIHELLALAPVNLAVSLHATTDAVRDELVPLNKRFPLDVLLGALRDDELVTRRRPVFFEYTLIAGVNDSVEDARRLPSLLRGIPCKLNAIAMNPHPDSPYRAPSQDAMDRFTAAAHSAGMRVTLRRSRGDDIDAACGQLAARTHRAPAAHAQPETRRTGV